MRLRLSLSVLPQSVVKHPFELHREDKFPGPAVLIRERGIWPRQCPFSVFLAPAGAKDRFHEFRAACRDTLLGGIIARIKFDDRSHLFILDNSDLVEFIHHHAWFEGDEVALSREDPLCLSGNLTGRTSKKRQATRSSSGQVFSNVAGSFLVETEQHELEPEETGANALDCDAVASGDDDGSDDTASTWKPLTANEKRVIQNIHNNCGHPSRQEFLRALRLSRARSEVLNYVRQEFECPACAAKRHLPKPRMPAALPGTFRFNETLGVDLFEIESPDGTKITFCNMVCWSTLYQLCIPIFGQDSSHSVKVHNRAVDSIFWSCVGDHCGSREGICGHSFQRVHKLERHPSSHH